MFRRIRGFMMLAAIVVFLSNLSPEVWGHFIRMAATFFAENTQRAVHILRPTVTSPDEAESFPNEYTYQETP